MNREIKFRAWNIVTKTMIDLKKITPFALNIDTDGLFIPFSDGLPLMQYIGLKDKNKNEIYEGDIVTISNFYNAIIIWNEQVCSFQYAYHAIGKGTSIGGRMTNTIYNYETEVKYEIIGNIHENPELLNQA